MGYSWLDLCCVLRKRVLKRMRAERGVRWSAREITGWGRRKQRKWKRKRGRDVGIVLLIFEEKKARWGWGLEG